MLAEQVAAGTLPGVCERLPVEPLVLGEGLAVNPDWVDIQIGDYGGEIIYTVVHVEMKEPPFITDNRDPRIQVGGIYRDWNISDDFTEVTLTLRAGHKWSDGAPLTTEDVAFAVQDVLQNDEIYPSMPSYLLTGGIPLERNQPWKWWMISLSSLSTLSHTRPSSTASLHWVPGTTTCSNPSTTCLRTIRPTQKGTPSVPWWPRRVWRPG